MASLLRRPELMWISRRPSRRRYAACPLVLRDGIEPSKGVLPMAENDLSAALDRWEGEGGPDLPAWAARLPANELAETERRVLIALGAAVVAEWNAIDTELQRVLFRHAAGWASETALLRQQIARFLHDHKDDEATAREPAEGSTKTPRADR
jgi:hypothetical protein